MAKIDLQSKHITIDPEVRFGKPCIRGTRLAVVDILNMLNAGWTRDEILQEYPDLTKEDLSAAIEFATKSTQLVKNLTDLGLVEQK